MGMKGVPRDENQSKTFSASDSTAKNCNDTQVATGNKGLDAATI